MHAEYKKCHKCGFNVKSDTEFCPACGEILVPPIRLSRRSYLRFFSNMGIIFGVLFCSMMAYQKLVGVNHKIFMVIIAGLMGIFVGKRLFRGIAKFIRPAIKFFIREINYFRANIITKKIQKSSFLEEGKQRIREFMKNLDEKERFIRNSISNRINSPEIYEQLEIALSVIESKRNTYNAKFCEIKIIRFLNKIESLDLRDEKNISQLNLAINKGKELLTDLQLQDFGIIDKGEYYIQSLKKAIEACENLYENLLKRKALSLISEDIELEINDIQSFEILDEIFATFTIHNFLSELKDLETEAEDEIKAKIPEESSKWDLQLLPNFSLNPEVRLAITGNN
jgi:hypothetical protein